MTDSRGSLRSSLATRAEVFGARLTPVQAIRAAEAFDGSAFLGPTTVLVEGESIVGVERGHPDVPDGVEVATYDGTLLPGLIDCHVHLVSNGDIGSLEAAGSASDEVLDATIRASLAAEAGRRSDDGPGPRATAATGPWSTAPNPGCRGWSRRARR